MNTKTDFLNPNLIRAKGIDILTRELGAVETGYFLSLFEQGEGNWTEERKQVLKSPSGAPATLEEIKRDLSVLRNGQ
jgi:hypothetical protein